MSWLDAELIAYVRERYGEPTELALELELSRQECDLVLASARKGRYHDVTFFVTREERLALIRKPHYAPGLWRPPGGGLVPGESIEAGAGREAREELGVDIRLRRYLVRANAVFTYEHVVIPWTTHVVHATTEAEELVPEDVRQIQAARWGSIDELQGLIRERLLATGRALWRYRVALHDAAAEALRSGDAR